MNNGLWQWDKILTDWLFSKWLFALVPCMLIFLAPLWKKSKLLYTYLAYCCLSALCTWFMDYGLDKYLKFRTRPEILYWFMALLIGIGFMYFVPVERARKVFKGLFWINAIWIIVGSILGGEPYAGIYCNISLSLTLFAILFSFSSAWESTRSLIFHSSIALICFYFCHSLMGTIAVVGGVSAVCFFRWNNSKKWWLIPCVIPMMLALFTKEVYDRTKDMASGSTIVERLDRAVSTASRVNTWKLAWKAVHNERQEHRRFTGFGYGSWSSLGMILQAPTGLKKGVVYNIQAHNDMVQILFELGWVGLTLWFLLILDIINRARKRKAWGYVYFGVALLISSTGNFPRYLPIEHFAFFLAVKELYWKSTDNNIGSNYA